MRRVCANIFNCVRVRVLYIRARGLTSKKRRLYVDVDLHTAVCRVSARMA